MTSAASEPSTGHGWRRAAAVAMGLGVGFVGLSALSPAPRLVPAAARAAASAGADGGFVEVAADGGAFSYAGAGWYGSLGDVHLNRPVVGAAGTPDGHGYWMVAADGGVFAFGDADFFGSTGAVHLARPIVGMAATPDGRGYWLVASDGGVFAFGDAEFFGSTGAVHLARPIVGMAATAGGAGYRLVASDGGVFTFGDATWQGSAAADHLDSPVVGMAATPDGDGYRVVTASGAVESFGTAQLQPVSPVGPVAGIAGTPDGGGYRLVAFDGAVAAAGDAVADDRAGKTPLASPVVGIVEMAASGPGTAGPAGAVAPSGAAASAAGVATATVAAPTTAGAGSSVAPSALPAAASAQGVPASVTTVGSANWSGYVDRGGSYTAVAGTFTVPSLDPASEPASAVTEWVGIDGSGNDSLIQAGVLEQADPSTRREHVYPWWEILPADVAYVPSLAVAPGDSVAVLISRIGGGTWGISMTDETTSQRWSTTQAYTGPHTSAEWMVEAPIESGTQDALAAYAPAVVMSGLGVTGDQSQVEQSVMVQAGRVVAAPTPLTAAGFAVAYDRNASS